MRSTFALLASGLSLAAANPMRMDQRDAHPKPRSIKARQDDSGLTPGMTCNQLQDYYASQGSDRHEIASDWDALDVSTFLSDWVDSGDHSGEFEVAFARPWGLGDSWRDNCDTLNGCPSINCNDLGDTANAPDSAAAYMVLLSMAHLQDAVHILYTDIQAAWTQFDRTDAFFSTNFATNTPDTGDGDLLIKSILTGVGNALVATAVLANVAPITAAAVAVNGIFSGINNAISPPVAPDGTEVLGSIQQALNSTLDPLLGAVDGMFNDLKADGSYNDVSMTDLLAGGAFLDATTIPVLNNNLISATERQDVMLNHVNAAALNWAWRFTRVWAMSYPMSLEEYDTTEWYAGNDDTRLRYYDADEQRGFFYQSVYPQSITLSTSYNPRTQNPPGWANTDQLGFNTWDIMDSSWHGYLNGGYRGVFDSTQWLDSVSEGGLDNIGAARESVMAPGVFNVVQCPFDSSNMYTPDFDTFTRLLTGPGAIYNDNDEGAYPPICFCIGMQDKDGEVFENYINMRSWMSNDCKNVDKYSP